MSRTHRINFELDKQIAVEFRAKTILNETSIREVLTKAIEEYLKEE